MKVFLRVGEIECEVQVRAAYSPDVLEDIVHRAAELVITQRVTELVVEDTES